MDSSRLRGSRPPVLGTIAIFLLVAVGVCSPGSRAATRVAADADGWITGSFVAAFLTRGDIVLCSDGRAVNSVDGSVVSESWSKVYRLTDRAGLLVAGRDLPGVVFSIAGELSQRGRFGLADVVSVTERHLQRAWASLPSGGAARRPAGRAFVYLAGFDEHGTPRLYDFDTERRPALGVREVPLFDAGEDLEIAAIATSSGPNRNVSTLIVRHLDRLRHEAPGIDRMQLLVTAFNGAKAELAAANTRIGGQTFVTSLSPVVVR